MNQKTKILLIILIALLVGGLVFYVIHQHRQMREMVEQLEFEKEELQEEYEDLAIQFDGYQDIQLSNDSLTQKLAEEQQRVRDLLKEKSGEPDGTYLKRYLAAWEALQAAECGIM